MLTQGKDDDKEKWQNSRREACYTLPIEGTDYLNIWNIIKNREKLIKKRPA